MYTTDQLDDLKRWDFYLAAYRGRDALIDGGYITQHERESAANYAKRLRDLYSYNYSATVVDLINQFMFMQPPRYDFGDLIDNDLFKAYLTDSTLLGTSHQRLMQQAARNAGITGHVVLIVDAPGTQFTNLAEQMDAGAHPYVTMYWPQDVVSWKEAPNQFGIPELLEITVKDQWGRTIKWTRETWHITDAEGHESDGVNTLGEVPAVWLYATRPLTHNRIGISDIAEISYIDLSIIRNLSDAEEVIEYAAFPMMRKARAKMRPDGSETDDYIGPTAVLEFDPESPESKPDWLSAEVKDPIDSITAWIDGKIEHIWELSNLSGVIGFSGQAPSGKALEYMFAALNSVLSERTANVVAAELQILRLIGKYLDSETVIDVQRTTEFDAKDVDPAELMQLIATIPEAAAPLKRLLLQLTLPLETPEAIEAMLGLPGDTNNGREGQQEQQR